MKSKKVKVLVGTVLVVGAVSIGGFFIAYAAQIIDSFTDESKVQDTWNVEVDTGAGEVKLKTRECNDSNWICSASTTCSNLLGDGDYIIVANVDLGSTYQWKTSNTFCNLPQCDSLGGGTNLVPDNTINFSEYPARDACESMGGRLPSVNELSCIYNNRVEFGDNFGTGSYWSATEYDASHARRVYFSDGSTNDIVKDASTNVRCVLGW